MSTHVLTSPRTTLPGTAPADALRLTFPHILRSEWIKFRSLRSTVWTLAITVVVMVGLAVAFSWVFHAHPDADTASTNGTTGAANARSMVLYGVGGTMTGIAELAVAVLGVLVITGEYTTGMIRSTLAAVPQRLPALWAKGVVLAVSVFSVSTVAVAISWGVMRLFLGGDGLAPDLGDADTVRCLVGIPLYLTGIALFAFAIGALLRHSAGGLATVFGVLLVLPNLFQIPWAPLQKLSPFIPSSAGIRIVMPQSVIDAMSKTATNTVLGPWQGYGVLMIWVVVLGAAAAVLLRRRNA